MDPSTPARARQASGDARRLSAFTAFALALVTAAVCIAASDAPAPAAPAMATKPVLDLATARRVAAAAERAANEAGATVVIAVVDDGGHLLLLERLDDTQVASVEVGIGKARTAAIFRRPSRDFEEQTKNGRIAALALPGATPLQGGLPLTIAGRVVGAIGVSGNTPQQDEDIAAAGAAALQQQRRVPPRSSEPALR